MAKKISPNFLKIVKVLGDGQFHDGEAIGKTLKITRAAIWKTIKKLEEYGIEVNAVKGKGYALLEPLALLDAKEIKKNIENKNTEINVFETIDSTISYLKSNPVSNVSVCLAEHQFKGRGRLGRSWYAPFGKNIYLSCLYHFQKDVSELSGLSLIAGLAVVKALESYQLGSKLCVKWPNDIIYDGKKLGGILIDIQAETHGACNAIISIGLNVNMRKDKDQKISQTWTSLLKILGHNVDRSELCARIINNLIVYVQRFDQHGLTVFNDEWLAVDCLVNSKIALDNLKQRVSGIAKGINDHGHLLLQLSNGKIAAFSAGDVTIVKNH
jgi:BirA family biotin operon repressor/biotin-[acetyl-CoA-carboxylase] ligase